MAKKTQEQIDQQIKWLTENKPKIRKMSAFGDDNHAAISAQIFVLKGDVPECDIFNRYDGAADLNDLDSALEARAWMDGLAEQDTLSEDWECLIQ